MADIPDIGEVFHAQGIGSLTQKFVDGLVEALRVQPKYFGRIDAQGTVHKDGHARNLPGFGQFIEGINDLLGAPDRKCRYDDLPFAFDGLSHEPRDFLASLDARGMYPIAISRFDLEVIDILNALRVAQDVVLATPDISAKEITKFSACFAHIQDYLG